jgi:Zn-dependent protease with chaperone function
MPIELPPGTASYSDRNPPPRNRQLLKLLGIVVALAIFLIWAFGAIANQMIWWIPPSVEQQLGRVFIPAFEKLSLPSETQTTLNQLLDRLETHLPREQKTPRDYRVLYIPDSTINAMALPGDRIVVYRGLLAQVKSENELMMVLGHELGHFANRDHLRGLGQALLWQVALGTLFGDPGSLTAIAGAGVARLSSAQFSQQQELQADEFGLNLLHQTYGHVGGATDFFAMMAQKGNQRIDWFDSHPASRKRVQSIQALTHRNQYLRQSPVPLPAPLENPKLK